MSLPAGYVQDPLFDIEPTPIEKKGRQRSLFPVDIQTQPLKVSVTVSFLRRKRRAKCALCAKYRVVFVLQASSGEESSPICGKCAGIR